MILQAVVGGFVLDALFGDPAWLPHPVEMHLPAGKIPACPPARHPAGRAAGRCRDGVLPAGGHLSASLVCLAAAKLSPWLGLAVQMFWCGQALAARGLAQESTNVYAQLIKNDLPAARKAVSRIVGRDTQDLTAEGVTKAAVETVAENASDGVIAPLLYMLIGGAPLALTYKAINTMDSMLGYKNEKYLYFGRAAAKLDDVANYIPSLPPFCGWPLRPLPATMPRAHGASGGGTGATTPAPTAPRPKAPAPVHWACSWPARLTILANITPSLPSVMPCAPLNRRTSCAPTA